MAPRLSKPELNSVHGNSVTSHGFKLTLDGTIPPLIANKYTADVDSCTFAAACTEFAQYRNSLHVDDGTAYVNATTHQSFEYNNLSQEEIEALQSARDEELSRFDHYKVFKRVRVSDLVSHSDIKCLPTRWVDTKKLKKGARVFKSRLVIKGHLDTRLELITQTGACPQESIRLNYLAAMTSPNFNPANIRVIDVRCAFLQAPLLSKTPVAVIPPVGHPDRGVYVWKLINAMYGLPDAPYAFEVYLSDILVKLGYVRVIDGIWVKMDKTSNKPRVLFTLTQFADDLQLIPIHGDGDQGEAELRAHLDLQPAEPLARYVGCDHEVTKDYIRITQEAYASTLAAPAGNPPTQPLPSSVLEEEDNSEPLQTMGEITKYRSDLGAYAYLATTSRPDLSYSSTYFSKFNQVPTKRARRLLDSAMRYAKATAKTSIVLKKTTKKELHLVCHCDASFASTTEIYPQSGYVVMLGDAPLMWKSCKQKRVCRSTLRAELASLDLLCDQLAYYRPFLDLFWDNVHIEIGTDANDLVALLKAVHPWPVQRALTHKILW
jgi:hypothetical protein